ncbi:MAG: adenylate/guanylate cyclase domain-containing protein [Streptosporangiaceae bacterium]
MPAGTVTMLFTDIEGSTALLSRLGDQYGQALSDHRTLMRAAFASWHGREMSTEGDSFFVVFDSAADAVACALAAQRALAGHDWPGGDPRRAARLAGAADTIRHESGMLLSEQEAAMLEDYIALVRAAVAPGEWEAELTAGRALSQDEALALLLSLDPAGDRPS